MQIRPDFINNSRLYKFVSTSMTHEQFIVNLHSHEFFETKQCIYDYVTRRIGYVTSVLIY